MKVSILAFAAHPDDIEISAAGTLMKHLDMGKKCVIVDLTEGELGTRGTAETRKAESINASKILGITQRVNLKLADGFFEHSKENLIKLIEQIRFFKPDVVLANAVEDRHPDHGKAAKLAADACFLAGLRKIETTYQGEKQEAWRPKAVYHYIQERYIKPDFVVDITPFADRKIEALKAFKTQFFDPDSKEPVTPISTESYFDFLKGRWLDFGKNIGVKYAEGFTSARPVGIDDITSLL
ncbi:MAG: bacillithiol biosynthesis deacetylase BshB1 [Crocinitomicaceae bacterium]|nr:bacillithiol biosynthesis deacetylase BshB1 [Crocinitomicaceae bacterium]